MKPSKRSKWLTWTGFGCAVALFLCLAIPYMAGWYVNGIRLPERLRAEPEWARGEQNTAPTVLSTQIPPSTESASTSRDEDRAAAMALAAEYEIEMKRHFEPGEGAEAQTAWKLEDQEAFNRNAARLESNRNAWLGQKKEGIERAERAVEAVDAPGGEADRMEARKWLFGLRSSRNSISYSLLAAILAAETGRCLDARDEAGAFRGMLDFLRMESEFQEGLFERWARANPVYRKEEDAFGSELEQTASRRRERIDLKNQIRTDFAVRRSQLAANLDLNWDHPFFGYDVRENPGLYWISFNVAKVDFEIPHLDRLASTTMQAMKRKKSAAAALEASDRFWKGYLDRLNGPYAELERFRSTENRMEPEGYLVQVQIAGEARLNVMRAALDWRRDPAKAEAEQKAVGAPRPDSPWHDPFTGISLHVQIDDAGSSPTVMIFSVGPNLRDDTGSDPAAFRNQESKSFGDDIAIRIPGGSGK